MADYDGEAREVPDPSEQAVAHRQETQAQIFNPLDAEPVSFKRQLTSRQENYDALAMHLRDILVPDKDFGRIHVANKQKCPRPWECSPEINRGHWSDWQLFSDGGDKILGVLGLGVSYPSEQDYVRAALKGMSILDVIMKCYIESHGKQIIAEGMGACGRDEVGNSLNNAIKRSCKRARLDAVHRLPAVKSLFEADFLAEVAAAAAKKKGGNTTSARARQVRTKFDTGAHLEVMPIGRQLKGKRFADMEDRSLAWIVEQMKDKPDIEAAARRELERRHPEKPDNTEPEAPPAPTPEPPKHQAPAEASTTDDWLDEWTMYDEQARREGGAL